MASSNNFSGVLSNSEASAGGKIIEIYAKVKPVTSGSYYGGASDKQLITIGVPGQDNITGGGYFDAANPIGIYADPTAPRVNFGFTMKYNKSGKNLMGQANVIFRAAGGISYQMKSNAINSLTVVDIKSGAIVTGKRAVFLMKANFNKTEILTDGTVVVTSLGGNLNLSIEAVEMLDGTKDKLSVTLTDAAGGLLYASNWSTSVAKSLVQDITNGKINVRGNNTSSPIARTAADNKIFIETNTPADGASDIRNGFFVDQQLTLTASPNPTADKFSLVINGRKTGPIVLRISDATGKIIETRSNVSSGTIQLGSDFRSGIYIVEVIQDKIKKQLKLIKL
jgi:hypothetical protein